MWLDAYVTDFLSRARAQGYAVPDLAFRNALSVFFMQHVLQIQPYIGLMYLIYFGVGILGMIDRLDRGKDRLAILPGHEG